MLLLWRTTARIGTLRSLDLRDVYLGDEDQQRLREELESEGYASHVVESSLEEATLPFLYPRQRPESDTRFEVSECAVSAQDSDRLNHSPPGQRLAGLGPL